MNKKPVEDDFYSSIELQKYSKKINHMKWFRRFFVFLVFAFFIYISFNYHILFGLDIIVLGCQLLMLIFLFFYAKNPVLEGLEFLVFGSDGQFAKEFKKSKSKYDRALCIYFQNHVIESIPKLNNLKCIYLYRRKITSKNEDEWNQYRSLLKEVSFNKLNTLPISNRLKVEYGNHLKYRDKRFNKKLLTPNTPRIRNVLKVNHESDQNSIRKGGLSVEALIENVLQKEKLKEVPTEIMANIGLFGEMLVIQDQERILRKAEILNGDFPIHVSKLNGDQFGFDIISLDLKLNQIFIEVKSTVSDSVNTPFFMSSNEINKLNQYPDVYFIARVTNCDLEMKTGKIVYYSYKDLQEKFIMEPNSFKVKLKQEKEGSS